MAEEAVEALHSEPERPMIINKAEVEDVLRCQTGEQAAELPNIFSEGQPVVVKCEPEILMDEDEAESQLNDIVNEKATEVPSDGPEFAALAVSKDAIGSGDVQFVSIKCEPEWKSEDEEDLPVLHLRDEDDPDPVIDADTSLLSLSSSVETSVEEEPKNTSGHCHQCSECDKSFRQLTSLWQHMKSHSGYHCSECGKIFLQESYLKKHLNIHSGQKAFHCPICQKPFVGNWHLQRHMSVHTGERIDEAHFCSLCDKKFTIRSSLKSHMRIHTGERPYVCSICDKAFNRSSSLKLHVTMHTGERSLSCRECNRRFSIPSRLKSHMVIHTGQREHHCKLCDKKFTTQANLRRHMLLHDNMGSFCCCDCFKSFSRRNKYNKHLSRFPCEKCPKTFCHKGLLKQHTCEDVANHNSCSLEKL